MKSIFKKKQTSEVVFFTDIPGLADIPDLQPQPAINFIPDWFKKSPNSEGSVKHCPSFPEYFSQGYVIPLWTDITLFYNPEIDNYGWESSSNLFKVEFHGNNQFLNFADFKFLNSKGIFVFKLECPWKMITPKGYSTYQLPMFYSFNEDFTILPGIIRTDIHHQLNQQLVLHKSKETILIKRGTPIAQYIPFKREKLPFVSRAMSTLDKQKYYASQLNISSQFRNTGSYLRMRRQLSND